VLGFLAIAAAARALYYVDARYQLVATPGGRRTIYECFLPLLIAAFFAHGRLSRDKAVTKDKDSISPEGGHHVKRPWLIRFRCDLCVFGLLLFFYIVLVLSVCLLIEFCIVPVEAVFVLRSVFALFAVLLAITNIHGIATSSGRHITTQVVLCALFVIRAGFSAVDAATRLFDDLALLFQQNADILVAVKGAEILLELCASVVLCIHSLSTFFGFSCNESEKSTNEGRGKVPITMIDDGKLANFRQGPVLPANSPRLWLSRLLGCSSKKSKVLDVRSAPPQISLDVVHAVGWASTADLDKLDGVSPLPPATRVTRSR